jgi:aryl-alcohol dehydrogenase-like predicted oxidoreductase
MISVMNYGTVPYVKKPLSRIIFGTALPDMMKGKTSWELLDSVYDAGINTFDTAESYGDAEAALGEWIYTRNLRDKVVIITKGAGTSKWRKRLTTHDILTDIETSFARLKTDYIDIYLLHRDNPAVPVGPIVELLHRLHQEGRIGAFGGSNWDYQRVAQTVQHATDYHLTSFSVASPNFSLAEMIGDPVGSSISLNGMKNREALEWFKAHEFPILAYSSLARGFFSGRIKSNEPNRAVEMLQPMTVVEYAHPPNFERLRRAEILASKKGVSVSQIAFAWIFSRPVNVFPITSSSSITHIQESIDAMRVSISPAESLWLNLEQDELI